MIGIRSAIQATGILGCARRSSCSAAAAASGSGHAGGSCEHPVRADKIAALADRLARQPHRLAIIASDEQGIGGNTGKECRERIARAQTKRAASSSVALLAAAAIGQRQAIKALSQRAIR